jgi:pimeloyl-ACP methyl ester carboxylesterase
MKHTISLMVVIFCFIASLTLAQTDTATSAETINQLIDIGAGRSLYLECVGTGSPTVILEPGEGAPRDAMDVVRDALKEIYQVCSYDRANKGQSSTAPTPRTAQDIVDDLAALLAAAQIPTPYLIVGSSAGGTFVQLYAARHPDQVMGVLAMNSVPPAEVWFEDALPS